MLLTWKKKKVVKVISKLELLKYLKAVAPKREKSITISTNLKVLLSLTTEYSSSKN